MSELPLFQFDSEEWDLFCNALNEVLNGFVIPNFEYVIGIEHSRLAWLLEHLHTLNKANKLFLNISETRTIRNALCETIHELGVEEFHIRTGFDLERGKAILKKLNQMLEE